MQEILDKYELKKGKHPAIDDGACVMELVSYIANEPWSDHPKCACPVLTKFAITYNDRVDDTERQQLKTLIPKLLNSRDKSKELKRGRFLALKAVTVFLPDLTDALELTEISAKLRSFTDNDFSETRDYIKSVKPQIRKAADAAGWAAGWAADADASKKKFWLDVKKRILDHLYDALNEACDL